PNNLQPTIEVEVLQLNVVEVESLNDVSIDYGEDYEPPNQLLVAYGGGNIDDNNYINMACANWEFGYWNIYGNKEAGNTTTKTIRLRDKFPIKSSTEYTVHAYDDFEVVFREYDSEGELLESFYTDHESEYSFTTSDEAVELTVFIRRLNYTGSSSDDINPEMVGKELKVKLTTGNDSYTTNRTEITDVSWGEYDELAEGKQTIKGDLLIRDIYKNTDDLQAEYKITVEKREVVSVEEIDNQEVEYTTSFDIPSEVEITLDNDEVLTVDAIDLS